MTTTPNKAPKYILTDAGFWLAPFDGNERREKRAIEIIDAIAKFHVVMPWPITYEVLRTRLVSRSHQIIVFEKMLKDLAVEMLDDRPYRDKALAESISLSKRGKRHISLVDMIVRYMIEDEGIKVHHFVTFNERDFIDVCARRRVTLFTESLDPP